MNRILLVTLILLLHQVPAMAVETYQYRCSSGRAGDAYEELRSSPEALRMYKRRIPNAEAFRTADRLSNANSTIYTCRRIGVMNTEVDYGCGPMGNWPCGEAGRIGDGPHPPWRESLIP